MATAMRLAVALLALPSAANANANAATTAWRDLVGQNDVANRAGTPTNPAADSACCKFLGVMEVDSLDSCMAAAVAAGGGFAGVTYHTAAFPVPNQAYRRHCYGVHAGDWVTPLHQDQAQYALTLSAAPSPGQLVHSGTPPGIAPETDCAMRQLAWEYGRKLQPSRGAFKTLYDALQLGACGVPLPPGLSAGDWRAKAQQPTPPGALELRVDPKAGDDALAAASAGDHPFATIAAAVDTAVAARQPGQAVHVVLRGGTHFVSETIQLTSAHSHLTIRNADGE
jgi:hypothetical protein